MTNDKYTQDAGEKLQPIISQLPEDSVLKFEAKIAGCTFGIDEDGVLVVIAAGGAMADYKPLEAQALMAFLRLPGARAILEGSDETVQPSVDLQDASNWASGIVNAAINMYAGDLMTGAARTLWDDTGPMDERYGEETHLGYIKVLYALSISPDAIQAVLRRTRSALVKADPRIAVAAHELSDEVVVSLIPAILEHLKRARQEDEGTAPQSLVVPRLHTFGATTFGLDPDGNLTIEPAEKKRIELDVHRAFDLLTFMRVPGVAELIDQKQAEYELMDWDRYQSDRETIDPAE